LRKVDLEGSSGRLEAVLNPGSPQARFAAVVCHPHPKGGGSLHNKVVYRAMKVLNAPEFGFAAPVLRFNFRGTGRSQGEHDGRAESADVLAAQDWLGNEFSLPLVAVGFSFGAVMVLKAASEDGHGVRAIAALGLPTHAGERTYRHPFLRDLTLPKLFLSGDCDQFASRAELEQAAASASDPKQLKFVPGADHFFTGQLEAMQQALAGWLKEYA
jgi:alpha/beta superfamily hydrolase